MSKRSNSLFICSSCGYESSKWSGQCPECEQWGTLDESAISNEEKRIIENALEDKKPENLGKINTTDTDKHRNKTGFREFDRVLGGGLVKGQVLLISGEPGIGKSTLLLQVSGNLGKSGNNVLYTSAEESASQVGLRANRILSKAERDGVNFLGSGNLGSILHTTNTQKADVLIVDSMQTLYDAEVSGLPGGISQIRHCISKLVTHAKNNDITLLLVGHVTKDGSVGGPKMLEHMVDTVLYFEGEKDAEFRILRAHKNRFGSTGEVGIFEMEENGLTDMDIIKSSFANFDEKQEVGVAKTIIVEGDRPILIDIQALVSNSIFPYPKRVAEGFNVSKLQLLTAIADRQKTVQGISDKDVYVRVSGGYNLRNVTYADLAIMAAMRSAASGKAINSNFIYVGEVTLNGKVVTPSKMTKAIEEISRFDKNFTFFTSLNSKKSSFTRINRVKEIA